MDLDYYSNHRKIEMNDSWHIPRASLNGSSSGASSGGSSKSNSNPPTVTRYNTQQLNLAYKNEKKLSSRNYSNNNNDIKNNIKIHNNGNSSSSGVDSNHSSRKSSRYKDIIKNDKNDIAGIKRGSRSSQGSTDSSNSSSRSGTSGSLLLTAANLERFVAIHNKANLADRIKDIYSINNTNNDITNYTVNVISAGKTIDRPDGVIDLENSIQNNENNSNDNINDDGVLTIDPNLHFVKTKDLDTMSIASSTHFTMVNGIGGPQKKIKSGLCSRGHQITVLIVTMSSIFLIGILFMVYLMEMRAREMSQLH